ncbi:MAG: shikimate dehydrogenase [Sulfurimonas sp. RIFOXYD12_FULL_33_39]|uniref:shikimate dehydrogenase n=1 Tax=unclassified Sulfurimonas TaxID=2623549 RepID=UPI0008B90809|nr:MULTISPECIES: shikimate dehydrogenase [unclassified Sulfurimonas]OHE09224.1 MAG: shikimate dehydrogenase [Sulfurimonas sp. RIFOXYD12_FULL_33_39]OHE12993.1 MAG: shikimate dehydrogenase [Sulfurimonas sp. RIFOXYD2_FULL_34_21]DAB28425.1 MAG TPA: shikimate dehydrogenase [Sulfurimonas sp. UBA10385]
MKKLFAIFGDPVSHSRSPLMHNCVFKHLDYPACYTRVHLKDGTKLKETFFALGLSGANITVPHKEAAYTACDEVRGFATKVGVVNTIINENGRLIGYNTDADGFMFAIKEFGDKKNILILGAGGTAKALAARFLQDGIKVTVLNRSKNRLSYFKELGCKCYSWEDFKISKYDLVVNTTSAGLKDEELPAPKNIIESLLDNTSYVADAIYGKTTPFLKLAHKKNIICKDGADMLLGQGILANELFINYELKTKDIKTYMSKSFEL